MIVLMTRLVNTRMIRAMWRLVFKPASRYPADPRAVFILALSAFSGLGALVAEAAPATLEALLPHWGVVVWGILLIVGSFVTLGGMLMQSLNGVVIEQIGSVIVGVTTIFYSILAIVTLGGNAIQPVGIILAWGISCFIRWIQLQSLLLSAYHKGEVIQDAKDLQTSHDHMRGE